MGIKFSSKITTDYSGTFFSYLSKSQLQRSATPIQSASQNFSLNYFPTVRWMFKMTAEQYYVNNSFSASHNYYFADLAIRYKPKKSKLNYEFSCQNLFNTKLFSTAFLSNNIETLSEYRIRTRQMLFKIDFPF
jgi:outer membrane receptor protein involved in Fe transport